MKISLVQHNYTIADFKGNSTKIIQSIEKAREEGVSLVVFSELSVCGYPPLDLLEHKYFIEEVERHILKIAEACQGIAAIVGAPVLNTGTKGKNLYNAGIYCKNGKIEKVIKKALLPTYDVFDEYRYFEPAGQFEILEHEGYRIALTICEDLWYQQPLLTDFGKDKLYSVNPLGELAKQKPDFVVNIAASPFAYNHDAIKSEILVNNAIKYNLPILYVNQVGAQTEIIFDGGSRIIGYNGNLVKDLPLFEEGLITVGIDEILDDKIVKDQNEKPERLEKIHDALVLGIKDYFSKMRFKSAVLGLSGGIDSAVTLVLAAEALGSENVRVLLLPSKFSSDHSIKDARDLAENLGVKYDIITIQEIVNEFDAQLSGVFKGCNIDITEENVQARVRGILLMAISNKFGNILLNTSNKSEAAVGYGTLYGDMAGGLSVLGDVYKTDVFLLARYINRKKEIIPNNSIIKPPSAELRPDQQDTDSLPEYDVLDDILYKYIELRMSVDEIVESGANPEITRKAVRMVNNNEYKRFQTPPVLRISSKAFGLGRRMPLVAKY